jgi:hypothetical protein
LPIQVRHADTARNVTTASDRSARYETYCATANYRNRLMNNALGGLVDEDLLASGRGEYIVLGFGVLIAGGDPSAADSHGAECIANPRHVDVGVYTATFTVLACGNLLPPRVSRERSYQDDAGSSPVGRLDTTL